MLKRLYRDFDEFKDDVRDVECTMSMVNPNEHQWSIDAVLLPDVRVQLGRLGSGNIVEGQSRAASYLLYLPLTNSCSYRANGTVIGKGSFMILGPGCEFALSTRDLHDWCAITVPTYKVNGGEDKRGSTSAKYKCRVTSPMPHLARQFGVSVEQLVAAAANGPSFESSPAALIAASELTGLAQRILGAQRTESPDAKGRPRLPRATIIRRSMELLEQRRGQRVFEHEIAAAAGVSERTLREAFKEYFGVPPTRYLQLKLLNKVNRELRQASRDEVSVTEIYLKNGVWEFGRFSSRYQRLFGERPSETLRAIR